MKLRIRFFYTDDMKNESNANDRRKMIDEISILGKGQNSNLILTDAMKMESLFRDRGKMAIFFWPHAHTDTTFFNQRRGY